MAASIEEKVEDHFKARLRELGVKYYTKTDSINPAIEKALKAAESEGSHVVQLPEQFRFESGKVLAKRLEDAKRRRALRLLEKQAWSLDFLSMALVKAGQHLGEGIVLVIENRDGGKMTLSYDAAKRSRAVQEEDSVFMHLDDDLAVERFIRENSRR